MFVSIIYIDISYLFYCLEYGLSGAKRRWTINYASPDLLGWAFFGKWVLNTSCY